MSLLRAHGVTRDATLMTQPPDGAWHYQQIELGYNYRMSELQAALGESQLRRLDAYVAQRHKIANRYQILLAELPITLPWQHPDTYSAWHLYVIRLHLNKIKTSHKAVFDKLRQNGIGVNLHYIPIHFHPYYLRMGFKRGDFPQSELYYQEAISLPIFTSLTENDQNAVVDALKLALK